MAARHMAHAVVRNEPAMPVVLGEYGSAILNCLTDQAALLDCNGVIVAVNEAWRRFAVEHGLPRSPETNLGVGASYLDVCHRSRNDPTDSADAAREGIRRILAGQSNKFQLEFPCHSPEVERWFTMTVTPLDIPGPCMAMVLHTDISARKAAEIRQIQNEQQLAADSAVLSRLHELSMRRVGEKEVDSTIRDILSLAVEVTEADIGSLLLLDGATGELVLKAQIGSLPGPAFMESRVEPNHSGAACTEAVRTRSQVVIEVDRDPIGNGAFQQKLNKLGFRVVIATPIVSRSGRILGAVATSYRNPITPKALRRLDLMARQAADLLAISNSADALRVSEKRFVQFVKYMPGLAWIKDHEGRYVEANDAAAWVLGKPRSEVLGRFDEEMLPAEGAAKVRENDQLVITSGEAIQLVERLVDGAGVMHHFLVSKFLIPGFDSKSVLVGGMAVDIAERIRAEEQLRETQYRLGVILQHANIGLWDWNLTTNEVIFSREWKSQLGYNEEEITNRFDEWQSRVHPDDFPAADAKVQETIARGFGQHEVEFRMRHKDGSWRWIMAPGALIPNPAGRSTQMVGFHLDITERKRADATLRGQLRILEIIATEESLSTILNEICREIETQLPDFMCSIMLLDDEGTHLSFAAGSSLPKPFRDGIDGVAIGPNVGSCGTAAFLRKMVIVADISSDPLWADFRDFGLSFGLKSCWSVPIFAAGEANGNGGVQRVLGTFALYGRQPSTPSEADLQIVAATKNLAEIAIERHRAESAIRDSEDRLRTLLENLENVAVQAYEQDGTITFWNRASERIFGYSADEALGRDILELLYADAASTAAERRFMNDAVHGQESLPSEEMQVLRRDGALITVVSKRTLHKRAGRAPEFFCFDVDVTARKRAEEELALRQAELAHTSRLSTLGQMIAALSHEIAQPLTAIGNYAKACDQMLGRDEPAQAKKLHEYIRAISEQSQRCTAILGRLRDFSRRAQPERSSCDLRQLVNYSVHLVASELRRQNIRLEQRIPESLPLIVADHIQVQQVIVNLLTNACDALSDEREERRIITLRLHGSEQGVELAVDDMGTGFDPEIASRLFEPFFTTKPEGLGIGLNVCESIVRSHGGQIDAFINDQGGATFRIRFPNLGKQ